MPEEVPLPEGAVVVVVFAVVTFVVIAAVVVPDAAPAEDDTGRYLIFVWPAWPDSRFFDHVDGLESRTVYFPALTVTEEGLAVQYAFGTPPIPGDPVVIHHP